MDGVMGKLTVDRLRELLRYDAATGLWTWLTTRPRARAGTVAGGVSRLGYRCIKIDGERFLSSRLAFLYMTGEWPKADVDHKNSDRSDDRWENLRDATASQNLANRGPQKNNTSGFKGVSWNKQTGKWLSQITVGRKTRNLGRFDTKEAAHAAYVAAANAAFGEFARAA